MEKKRNVEREKELKFQWKQGRARWEKKEEKMESGRRRIVCKNKRESNRTYGRER